MGTLNVVAGRSYLVEVRFSNFEQIDSMSPYVSPFDCAADDRLAAVEASDSVGSHGLARSQ